MTPSVVELQNRIREIVSHPTDDKSFDFLGKLLDILNDISCVQSYTLYVRDPLTEELRLERFNRIRHIEPIIGFTLSLDDEHRLRKINSNSRYERKQYFRNPDDAKLIGPIQHRPQVVTHLRTLVKEYPEIFGTFSERESVVSCIRYECSDGTRPQMVLFANLSEHLTEDASEFPLIDQVFDELERHLPEIHASLDHEYAKALRQLTRLMRPITRLSALTSDSNVADACHSFISGLLDAVVTTMNVSQGEGFASIHLFEPDEEGGILRLAACTAPSDGLAGYFKLFHRKSIVAWVALKEQPLMINDMRSSAFRHVRVTHEMYPNTLSELAVPMMAGDRLVGVINIETRSENAFTRQDLQALQIAASAAAIAYRVVQSMEDFNRLARSAEAEASLAQTMKKQTERLLKIAHDAANDINHDESYLSEISLVLKEWCGADRVEVWVHDQIENKFGSAGASYGGFKNSIPPRPSGWTQFVFRSLACVWIDKIDRDSQTFRSRFWDVTASQWIDSPRGDLTPPNQLNDVVFEEGVCCELGVPIVRQGKAVGVIWLKHDAERHELPEDELLSMLTMLTGQVALMLDLMALTEKREEREVRQAIVREYFPAGPLKEDGMEGHLLYEPCEARLGGDFFVGVPSAQSSWTFLIGDVAGHGYRAALKMLPLITAFRIYQKECGSPDYALGQLITQFYAKEQFGTGLSFVGFRRHESSDGGNVKTRHFVAAASAGHPPLILIRGGNDLKTEALPSRDGPGHTSAFGISLDDHFSAQTTEVFAGDILIGYTDGIEESMCGNETFGRDRIVAAAITVRTCPPMQIAETILDASRKWCGGVLRDDATVFVARII